jgi:hypothetical protein
MSFFNFHELSKNFFNSAKLEETENSNFRKYFEKKYSKEESLPVTEIKVDKNVYKTLRDFFIKFNQDTQMRTFSEFSYSKYKFTTLKIITYKDLIKSLNISNSKLSEERLKKLSEENFDSPVNWKEFFLSVQDLALDKKINLDEFLHNLSNTVQSKKFNFKKYQNLYKQTKEKVLFTGIKTFFLENTSDPDFVVIKDKLI